MAARLARSPRGGGGGGDPLLHKFNPQNLARHGLRVATAGHAALLLDRGDRGGGGAAAARVLISARSAWSRRSAVWAFATAGHAAPVRLEAIAKAAVLRLGEFVADLANRSKRSPFAARRCSVRRLLEAIAFRRVQRVQPAGRSRSRCGRSPRPSHAAPVLHEDDAVRTGAVCAGAADCANTAWCGHGGHAAPELRGNVGCMGCG